MDNTKTIEQLNKLIEKTKEKKISWKILNENLLRWIKVENGRVFTMTIQSLFENVITGTPRRLEKRTYYIFTIQVTNPDEVVLQINTRTDLLLKDLVEKLFNEAIKASKDVLLDVVDKLLENL